MTIRNAVHNDCSASLAEIESMPTAALRTLWGELIGGSAPTSLRRELLIPVLAYKLQEKAFGGLKPSTRTHLRRLATSLAVDKSAPLTRESRFKPGSRLIREWRGETHEVTIRSSGFEYRGKDFAIELGRYEGLIPANKRIQAQPPYRCLRRLHEAPSRRPSRALPSRSSNALRN